MSKPKTNPNSIDPTDYPLEKVPLVVEHEEDEDQLDEEDSDEEDSDENVDKSKHQKKAR